jgi:hypothetical protein
VLSFESRNTQCPKQQNHKRRAIFEQVAALESMSLAEL